MIVPSTAMMVAAGGSIPSVGVESSSSVANGNEEYDDFQS